MSIVSFISKVATKGVVKLGRGTIIAGQEAKRIAQQAVLDVQHGHKVAVAELAETALPKRKVARK